MKRLFSTLLLSFAAATAAVAAAPAGVEAQCTWGCACMGNACGCNSNGDGGRCDASGSGCVVTKCSVQTSFLLFAPDGSVIRLAATEDAGGEVAVEMGGATRWEASERGGSVARHCSGLVLARYYPPERAESIREESRELTL